jgi:putative phosphoribosyl transferase
MGHPVATWSVRKVADPLQPELAIGAISGGHVAVWRNGQAALRCQEQALSQGWLQLAGAGIRAAANVFGDPTPEQMRNRHLIVLGKALPRG